MTDFRGSPHDWNGDHFYPIFELSERNSQRNEEGNQSPRKVSDSSSEFLTVSFNKVNGSMGLSIVAARGKDQHEVGIYIKSVVDGGAAALDGRLQAGDQLLEVDGRSLMGITQDKAAMLMSRTGQVINLLVAKQGAFNHGLATLFNEPSPTGHRGQEPKGPYGWQDIDSKSKSTSDDEGNQSPRTVHSAPSEILTVSFNKVNGSMGLSIVAAMGEGQQEHGIYIKTIVDGGAAALDGRLQAGDQLLEVDGRSLVGITEDKAARLMTQTGQVVNLLVAKQEAVNHGLATLLYEPSPTGHRGQEPKEPYGQGDIDSTSSLNAEATFNQVESNPSPRIVPSAPSEILTVSFNKVNGSMGLSIVAAIGIGQQEQGIYIKAIRDGGAAALDGRLHAGDQLLEVDGKSLMGITQDIAARLMTQTGQVVNLLVAKQGAFNHGLATVFNEPSPTGHRAPYNRGASQEEYLPPYDGFNEAAYNTWAGQEEPPPSYDSIDKAAQNTVARQEELPPPYYSVNKGSQEGSPPPYSVNKADHNTKTKQEDPPPPYEC